MKYLSLLLIAATVTFSSCGDDDPVLPVVTITDPAQNSNYTAGSSIIVSGSVTHETDISTLIAASSSTTFLLNAPIDISGVANKADFTWGLRVDLPAASPAGEYSFDVTATDADGDAGSERFTFNVQ